MARPTHEFAHAPGTWQRQLLGVATTGNLALLERTDGEEAGRRPGAPRGGGGGRPAGNGKAEVFEYLVEDVRVDVDAVDIDGRTPLFWAITCKGGHADIVRYLLDHGTNCDHVDRKRAFTPVHEAVKIGHCEIVELLLSRGAYVDTFSTYCGTPLHVAAQNNQDAAMKILLDHHADAGADVKGIRTATPLHAAARNGLSDVLKPLLDAGADPNVLDEFSHLPIQLAAYFGTRKDVEILFEVTSSRIPAVHDWSVDGIISYVKSEPKAEDHPLSKLSVAKLIEEGDTAMQKEEYGVALEFYNVAAMVDHQNVDSTLISNRSFCQLLLVFGEGALIDAHVCRAMQPDRADACWLQGYSYVLLQDYEKAHDAFLDGLKVEPGFDGIEKALREALRLLKEAHADKKNGIEVQYREAHFYL